MKSDYQKQVEDYLMGRLDPEELQKFNQRMAKDKTLAQEVKIQEALLQQINELGHLEMREKLNRIKKEIVTPSSDSKVVELKSKRKLLPIILSAAAILILLIIGYQVFNPTFSPQELYAQHYHAYPLPFNDRAEGVDQNLIAAGDLYQKGDYNKAIPILKSILDNTTNTDDRIQLALGISQLETGQYNDALQTFNQMKAESHNIYREQADWYSALVFLKLNDLPAAKSVLLSINNSPTHYFHKQAKELLGKIN